MSLLDYARRELKFAGLFEKDSDYGGALGKDVLKLVKVFAQQGHSGMSASMVLAAFCKVASYLPLAPLTGEDSEWNEVSRGIFQNRRCSRVFKENGEAYDIEGRVFRDPDGTRWTNRQSCVPVTFPYNPQTEVVERNE